MRHASSAGCHRHPMTTQELKLNLSVPARFVRAKRRNLPTWYTDDLWASTYKNNGWKTHGHKAKQYERHL